MTPATTLAPPSGPPLQPAGQPPNAASATAALPTPFRWTIADYRELGQLDVFRDIRTYLLDGEIYVVPNPNPPHDLAMAVTEDWLREVFKVGHHVRTQKGFDVGTRNDPGPDIAVVPGTARDYAGRTPSAAVLIVEVSETSLSKDITAKAEKYATAGVPDYWVIDLLNRRIVVLRDPVTLPEGLGATAYRTHLTFGPTDTVSPLAAPHASAAVADLLP